MSLQTRIRNAAVWLWRQLGRLPGRPWMWLALLALIALAPRGIVSAGELERGKWTEYLVFATAAQRLANNEYIHLIPHTPDAIAARPLLRERAQVDDIPVADSVESRVENHVFSYPPMSALLSLPLTLTGSYTVGMVLWYITIMVSLLLAIRLSWRMAYPETEVPGTAPDLRARLIPMGVLAIAITTGLAAAPIANQQNDSVLYLAVIGGACLMVKRHYLLAGLLFGLAAGSKGPLLLVLPLLVLRRDWRTSITTLVVAIGVNLLPDLFFTSPSGKLYLQDWLDRAALPSLREGGAAASLKGIWGTFDTSNQSLASTLGRLFLERPDGIRPGLALLDAGTVKALGLAASGSLLLLMAFTLWPWHRWSFAGARDTSHAEVVQTGRVFALVLLLGLLLSPKTSPAHYCMAIPAIMLCLRDAWLLRDRWQVALLLPALAYLAFFHKDLFGKELVESARFYGATCASTLLLTLSLARGIRLHQRSAAPPESVAP